MKKDNIRIDGKEFPRDQIREKVIDQYCRQADKSRVAQDPDGSQDPAELDRILRGKFFNATRGHLPCHVMVRLSRAYRGHIGELRGSLYTIPSETGETVICLSWAYPDTTFRAQFNAHGGGRFDPESPLADLVQISAEEILSE